MCPFQASLQIVQDNDPYPTEVTLFCSLEERYSKNNKRRRLAYALRRRQSPSSYRNRWDHICNEVGSRQSCSVQ